jgi:hypothetical protein
MVDALSISAVVRNNFAVELGTLFAFVNTKPPRGGPMRRRAKVVIQL